MMETIPEAIPNVYILVILGRKIALLWGIPLSSSWIDDWASYQIPNAFSTVRDEL